MTPQVPVRQVRTTSQRPDAPRIVHVVQHLQPGGIETMVLDFLDLCGAPGSLVVSLEGDAHSALDAWPRLRPYRERMVFLGKRGGLQPRIVAHLARLLKSVAPRAVHTHHVGPLLYGGAAARLAGIKRLVHTEHDAWYLADRRTARLVSGLYRLLGPTIVADARLVGDAVRRATGRAPLVVPNGIDTRRFSPGDQADARRRLGLPTDRMIIGTAGRLVPVKNQALLLRAFADIAAPNVEGGGAKEPILAIAGDGPLKAELQNLAHSLGLADRVRFLGRIDEMTTVYRALDLFCLTSDREGLPLSLLEAQACNVTVIATDTGGSSEAVCPVTGRLVPPGCQTALADAMIAGLADHGVSEGDVPASGSRPRDFVLGSGDAEAMYAAYTALYCDR